MGLNQLSLDQIDLKRKAEGFTVWVDNQAYLISECRPGRHAGYAMLALSRPGEGATVARVVTLPEKVVEVLTSSTCISVLASSSRIRNDPAIDYLRPNSGFYRYAKEAREAESWPALPAFNGLQGIDGGGIRWSAKDCPGTLEVETFVRSGFGWHIHGWRFDPGHNRWACLLTDDRGRLFWSWPINYGEPGDEQP